MTRNVSRKEKAMREEMDLTLLALAALEAIKKQLKEEADEKKA